MTHFHCYLVLDARDEVDRAVSKLNGTFMLNFKLSVASVRKMPYEIQKQFSPTRRTGNHETVPTITSKSFRSIIANGAMGRLWNAPGVWLAEMAVESGYLDSRIFQTNRCLMSR